MAEKLTFNPVTGRFDVIDDEVHTVTTASTTTNADLEVDPSGVVWFWTGGHRYKLVGTLSDPVVGTGSIVGANAALTLLGP